MPGAVVQDPQGAYPSVDPVSDSETELEYAVQLAAGVSLTTTFDFRIYKAGGTALDAYTFTPRVTVGVARADMLGGAK